MTAKDEQTSLRISTEALERSQELRDSLAAKGYDFTRSEVLRMALTLGLPVLAGQFGLSVGRSKRRKRVTR